MGERRRGESGEAATEAPCSSLLAQAVALLLRCSPARAPLPELQFSGAALVERPLFLRELQAFARAKEAAGYSREELRQSFAFRLFEREDEAVAVCERGLRVSGAGPATLGDPARGVYVSQYPPWPRGKSGFLLICKLIKGRARAVPESRGGDPSAGYDCHEGPGEYYVYEVSGGSMAERPRQVCPYILVRCQPRGMPALQSPEEQSYQAPWCPWRGQLCLRGRPLFPMALRSPHGRCLPAQLPPNLDIKHVMELSDLKKKLPEAAFGKKNYTGSEVCFQGVYSSLYEVEISNKDQSKMDQLVENLKEKDLVIIKYLQDQGILILLTSSALARDDGSEPGSLLALFLFSSPRALRPRAEKRDSKGGRGGSTRSNISLRIASVLPGLRYALRKAASSSQSEPGSACLQNHLQEYANLQEKLEPALEQNSGAPILSVPSPCQDEGARPSQNLLELSLAQLRRYLSDPSSYTLAVSAALECLSAAGRNLGAAPGDSCSSEGPDPAPANGETREKREDPDRGRFSKSITSPTKPWGRDCRRKSSRILAKVPATLQAPAPPGEEDSRSREAAKKKPNGVSSCPKKPGAAGGSNEPMLKLANLRLPHGRKRGAEVLAAEIVHKPQSEAAEKETSAPGGPGVEAKRPKTLENPDTRKAENGTKPGKSKTQKNVENRASTSPESHEEESEHQELSDSASSPGAEIPRDELRAAGAAPSGDSCDSHGLNLLADLALGSCVPAFVPKDSDTVPTESSQDSKGKSLRPGCDHRYHRADRQGKKSSKMSLNQQQLPEDSDLPASPPTEPPSAILSRMSNPIPALFQVLPTRKAAEAAEVNKHSIISAEHSYASPMPDDPRKASDAKGNPPGRNGARSAAAAAPLVGKVLPFRHQSSASEPARRAGSPRKKEDFSKSHTVKLCGDSLKVTCRWEEDYLFHLDSRYTNDALEKAVIRALHGPWDHDLPDDVEGMKLVLHMWVALFYRRPSKFLSNSRKVVEHSNPRKYVSINSSGDFLELSDDSQDCFGLETRPADSGSDPDQTPSSSLDPSPPSQGASQTEKSPADSQTDADGAPGAVDSTVSSSSGELPCGEEEEEEEEPSSTSCPESLSLQDPSRENLDGADREEPEAVPEESARDVSSVTGEEPIKEDPLDAGITPSPSEELGCPSESPGTENSGSQAPNSSTAPWTDPPCAPQENGERQEEGQEEQREAGSESGPGPPEDEEEGVGESGHSLGVEDGADPQPACDSLPVEAGPGSAEPEGGEESQERAEHSEKEDREVEENEELGDESPFLGPVDLVLSESSDAEMECEHGEQNPGNSETPKETPEEETPKETAPDEETPEEIPLETPEEMTPEEMTPEEMTPEEETLEEETPKEMAPDEETPGEIPMETPEETPLEAPEEMIPEEIPLETLLETPEEQTPLETPEEMTPEEMTPDEIPLEMTPLEMTPLETPLEFGAPEEHPVPSPASLASPCPGRSSPALSEGAGIQPGGFPEELPPKQDELPDPWEAPAALDPDTKGVGVASAAEAGSPRGDRGELLGPPEASLAPRAQPGPAGAALGSGSGRENPDQPSGERWEPAASTEPPCGQGMILSLSPDSSSACLTSPDGSVGPWAAPENRPMESFQTPSQSHLGRSSGFSQLGGGDADPDLNSLDAEEPAQGRNRVLGEEQQGSPCANCTEELDDPMGAGDGRGSPSDYPDIGDDRGAEEGEEVFPEVENSPGNDAVEPEIPLHQQHLLESEPSSSVREGISAIEELPRQQQSFQNTRGDSAPASPAAGDANPGVPAAPSQRESVLCRLWKPCREGGAAQVSPDGSFSPGCSRELPESPAPCSAVDPWDDPEALPGLPPSPDSARWSGSCGSPGSWAGEEPFPPEDLEGGRIPSPAPLPAWECSLCEPWDVCEHNLQGSQEFPDCVGSEVGEGGIPASPVAASPWDERGDGSGEHLEFSDAEDISDALPREEQLPGRDTHEGLAFEDPLEDSFGDSDQEYLEGRSCSPLPGRSSCIMRSTGAAGARTNWDSSSRSSVRTEEHGDDWDWEVPGDSGSFVVTRQCQERMENFQLPKRRGHRARESHLARSLTGTWRGSEEITQNTLDMECLRFHYKLKEILRNGKPPFSTSKSIFPTDFSPHSAPVPLSPRSRSPLRVTIPPSDTWPGRPRSRRDARDRRRGRSRAGSREPGAPFHLGKLRYERVPPEPRGAVALILDEYSEFQRVVLGRARAGSRGAARGQAGGGTGAVAFQGTIAELCGALRSRLRRVAAGSRPGMFYLLETGQEPFFDRVKALLKAEGFVRTEPSSFCRAQRRDGERLLVIVRNEDISSHIHSVPCLLELKRCPGVVFAGVDGPEDVTGDTFQELFQAGGFVVSDEELLERVTLCQLKEVVKVLEKLNGNGRWKWLLHHRESKKLRGDLRDDGSAQKKQLLLRWCRGAELLEPLPFHGCDAAPESRRVQCLLQLQAQHVHARFAVYLTENPSGGSREILESKGILVADINTFLRTVQKVAAPFRRSYW